MELPKVLLQPSSQLCLGPQITRSRTQPSTPSHSPPLLVRSLTAAPHNTRLQSPTTFRKKQAYSNILPDCSPKSVRKESGAAMSPDQTGGYVMQIQSENGDLCRSRADLRGLPRCGHSLDETHEQMKRRDNVAAKERRRGTLCGLECRSAVVSSSRNRDLLMESTEYFNETMKRPLCRRNLAKELDKEFTFKPELNQKSLKMASRSTRQEFPLVYRLTERRAKANRKLEQSGYTFAPRINPRSIKLAQERAGKIDEVQAKAAQQAAKKIAEVHSKCTFRPLVSEKSLRIAQMLGTSFEKRQEVYLEKRKKVEMAQTQVKVQPYTGYRKPGSYPSSVTTTTAAAAATTTTTSTATSTATTVTQDHTSKGGSCHHTPSPRLKTTPTMPSISSSPELNKTPSETESPPTATATLPPSDSTAKPLSQHGSDTFSQGPETVSQIKLRKRASVIANDSSPSPSSYKGRSRVKRRRSMTTVVPASPPAKQLEPHEMEGVCLNDLHKDRDRVKYIKMVAERKMKEKKIFLIHGGYRLVRKCLRERGWVELDYAKHKAAKALKKGMGSKGVHRTKVKVDKDGESSEDDDDSDVDLDLGVTDEVYEDEEEYSMVARLVRNSVPNFVWTLHREAALYDSLHKSVITNHFAKASSFTTKNDLCTNLRNLFWHGDRSPNAFFPRCYCFGSDEERDMFIDDYRFTAAMCILKILYERYSTGRSHIPQTHAPSFRNSPAACDSGGGDDSDSEDSGSSDSDSDDSDSDGGGSGDGGGRDGSGSGGGGSGGGGSRGDEEKVLEKLPERAVQLALKAGEAYLASMYHDDIEKSEVHLCPKVLSSEWDELVQYYYKIRDGYPVNYDLQLISSIKSLLGKIEAIDPQFNLDGYRNIWIIKPGASSRGRGIMCLAYLDDILNSAMGNASIARRVGRYVVQKYIERPLLIHNTKFDIRQWFLVTDWNPLTVWMYQDSYLRFSSQPYTLDSMDVSIHLCNNSIQKHYANSQSRSEQLPAENMWDSDTFQEYLSSIGRESCWEQVIYPGMKKALIHSLQVTQDEIEHRKNCFELYGADFMICADFWPWLIEINSSPTMESSTEVTARLCSQVLEDTLKVVIDRRENRDCDTGRFELAFKQAKVEAPPYMGMQLCIKGSGMKIKTPSYHQSHAHKQLCSRALNMSSKAPAPINAPLTYTNSNCRNSLKISYQTPTAEIML